MVVRIKKMFLSMLSFTYLTLYCPDQSAATKWFRAFLLAGSSTCRSKFCQDIYLCEDFNSNYLIDTRVRSRFMMGRRKLPSAFDKNQRMCCRCINILYIGKGRNAAEKKSLTAGDRTKSVTVGIPSPLHIISFMTKHGDPDRERRVRDWNRSSSPLLVFRSK